MSTAEQNGQFIAETDIQPLEWLHVHIPKTAGTSVRRALIDTYGSSQVLYYDTTLHRAIPSDKRLVQTEQNSIRNRMRASASQHRLSGVVRPVLTAVKNAIELRHSINPAELQDDNFKVLSGHFDWEKVHEWGLDSSSSVTVVRDPLERMWSHYQHWRRTGGRSLKRPNLPYDSSVTFEALAMDEPSINYQSRFIGDLTMKHIGVSDQLPALFEEIGLQVEDADSLRLNIGNHDGLPNLDKGFVNEFTELNRQDYELFHNARDTWI